MDKAKQGAVDIIRETREGKKEKGKRKKEK
jgi:hypothetical protein